MSEKASDRELRERNKWFTSKIKSKFGEKSIPRPAAKLKFISLSTKGKWARPVQPYRDLPKITIFPFAEQRHRPKSSVAAPACLNGKSQNSGKN